MRRATADAAAGGPQVEPGSLDEARAQLVSERARRQLCETELLTLKRQTDDALERQRKGAERSMRDLQGEVARLQAMALTLAPSPSPNPTSNPEPEH